MSSESITPYNGSSGWSGTSTSKARADREDGTGITGKRYRAVRNEVADHGAYGLTVRELREILDLHHGQASAALTNLHHAGHLQRLSEVRSRCKVYVVPEYVQGRETEPYERRRPATRKSLASEQEKPTELITWTDVSGRKHAEVVTRGFAHHLLLKGLIERRID